jgi:subtilisin family serine protease
VLTVGAYGQDRKIAPISITGPQVDLVAPGDRIATTGIDSTGYDLTTGTSGAAAVVSGAAALIRARFPKLTAAEVVHRLTATADDAGPPGRDDTYGYGRVDIVRALTADVKPPSTAAQTPGTAATRASSVPSSTVDTADLPTAASPLLAAAVLAGVVLLAGAVVVAVMLRRGRRRPNG